MQFSVALLQKSFSYDYIYTFRSWKCCAVDMVAPRGFVQLFSTGVCRWKKVDTRTCIVIAYCSWIRQRRPEIYDPSLSKFSRWSFSRPLSQSSFRYFAIWLTLSRTNDKERNLSYMKLQGVREYNAE